MVDQQQEDALPDVGVLVGRFQVPELHEGHRDVLDHVARSHDKFIVFLGNNATQIATASNPLDFVARKQMIEAEYPEAIVLYIEDMWSDELWSRKLDEQIKNICGPRQTVMLYGSRDSFISHYTGKHPTKELEAEKKISGTEVRKAVRRRRPKNSVEWREGAVWAATQRYDTTYPTVDIAVFDQTGTRIILGRKPFETMWRLAGGFAEPWSETYEVDARREAGEELNIEITDPEYVGSFKVNDWRYVGERDQIKTIVFAAKRLFGELRAGDDIEEAEEFDCDLVLENLDTMIMPNHRPFVKAAIEYWRKRAETAQIRTDIP